MAPVTTTEIETDDITAGGAPNPGTKKDKRLKANKGAAPVMAVPEETTEDALAEVEAAPTGKPFSALLCVEGLETSDGRMFELGSTTWRNPPLPFMVQDSSPHGPGQQPNPAWPAGQFTTVERDSTDPSRIIAHGNLMDNDAGRSAEELIRGAMRGLSIDGHGTGPLPPDQQPTAITDDGETLKVLTRFADTNITRATLVPTPAFEAACVWMDDEPMPQAAADAHGTVIATDTEPEVVTLPANAFELLVAAGGGPVNPEKDAFFQPEPNHRQEMIVDPKTGWVSGHLFGYKECHTAYAGTCEMAPRSRTSPPFVGFHRTEAHCADGSKVACGWIPINTDHGGRDKRGALRAAGWSQDDAWDHYENSGSLIAKVRASNGRHGVWLSGVLLPGLGDRELAIAQGLSVSGHWNVFTDPRDHRQYRDELLGILGGVPTPGYPETRVRPELLVASGGEILGHITPFSSEEDAADCTDCEEASMGADQDRILRLEAAVSLLIGALPEDVREQTLAALAQPEPIVLHGTAEEIAAIETVEVDVAWQVLALEPISTAEYARYVSLAKYNTDDRKKMASSGAAMPDGSFPIADADDLKAAIRSIGRASGSHAAVQAHIVKRAKALNLTSLLPDAWSK